MNTKICICMPTRSTRIFRLSLYERREMSDSIMLSKQKRRRNWSPRFRRSSIVRRRPPPRLCRLRLAAAREYLRWSRQCEPPSSISGARGSKQNEHEKRKGRKITRFSREGQVDADRHFFSVTISLALGGSAALAQRATPDYPGGKPCGVISSPCLHRLPRSATHFRTAGKDAAAASGFRASGRRIHAPKPTPRGLRTRRNAADPYSTGPITAVRQGAGSPDGVSTQQVKAVPCGTVPRVGALERPPAWEGNPRIRASGNQSPGRRRR